MDEATLEEFDDFEARQPLCFTCRAVPPSTTTATSAVSAAIGSPTMPPTSTAEASTAREKIRMHPP